MTLVEELGIDVLDVLTNTFGLDGEVVIDDLRILCPNPKHEDRDPSCYVRLTDKIDRLGRTIEAGTWHCFSCHAKGDLLSLGKYALGRKRSEVRTLLEPGNIDGQVALLQRKLSSFLRTPEARRSPEEWNRVWKRRPWLEKSARKLDSYDDGPKTYMLKRGFTVATIKKWGVRYVRSAEINTKKAMATIKNSIAIPIRDRDGLLIAWCLAKGTLINTPLGERRIEEIKPGDQIFGYEIDGTSVRSPVLWSGYSGTKRTVILRLSNGRSLRCTPDHKLLTRHGWKRADECRYQEIAEALPQMSSPALSYQQDRILYQACFSRRAQQEIAEALFRVRNRDQSTINNLREVLPLENHSTKESASSKINGRAESAVTPDADDLKSRASGSRTLERLEDQMGSPSALWTLHDRFDLARAQSRNRDFRPILARSWACQGTTQKAKEGVEGSRIQVDRSASGRSTPVVAQACSYARVENIEPGDTTEVYDISLGGPHAFGAEGVIVHNCYRRTDDSADWQPKYLYTHDSPRSLVWIGINHLFDDNTFIGDDVCLVEGALDAMWLDQSGIPAIAVGGSGVDVERARSLADIGARRLILFMDRDEAGQWAAQSIGSAVWDRMPIYVARYRKSWAGDDPQSLEPDQLHYAIDHAIPFSAWQLRLRLARLAG